MLPPERPASPQAHPPERAQLERLLAAQEQTLSLIAKGAPALQVLELLASTVEGEDAGTLCSFLLVDESGTRLRYLTAPSLPASYNRQVDGVPIGPQAGSCGTAAFRREMVAVSEIATDPLWQNYREAALAHGLRSCWSTPVFDRNGVVIGTFALYSREAGRQPTAAEIGLLNRFAHLAGIAMELERTERERDRLRTAERTALATAEESRQRLAFLAQASAVLNASLDYRRSLQRLGDLVVTQVADCFAYSIRREEHACLSLVVAQRDRPGTTSLFCQAPCFPSADQQLPPMARVIMTGEPELGENGRLCTGGDAFDSYVAAPIPGRTHTVGSLFLGRRRADPPFSPQDLAMVADLAQRMGQAVENALAHEMTHSITQSLAEGVLALDLTGRVIFVNQAAEALLGWRDAELLGQEARLIMPQLASLVQPGGQGGVEVVEDCSLTRKDGTQLPVTATAAPVRTDGQITGTVLTLRDISERKALSHRLEHLAYHDPLTGLPNRRFFMETLRSALQQSEKESRSLAVLFLDLDNFKALNDSLGHDTGDQVLVSLAQRISARLGAAGCLSRFGGDEFTLFINQVTDADDALRLGNGLLQEFDQPLHLGHDEFFLQASIGIAVSRPGDSAEDLLRYADAAMYHAKANGKGRCAVFDARENKDGLTRLVLETELRRALEQGDLRVHYQPIVALETGRVRALEALVRWEHPRRGMISPSEFIPLAEATGLIVPIGRWVLATACRQTAWWHRTFPELPRLQISVNLSPRQFLHPDLVSDVAGILREAELDPCYLQLEITEGVMIQDAQVALNTLQRLQTLGVRLAIDDFGTGYSAIGYLRQFPVDSLKIDRSFLQDIGQDARNRGIVEAVIAMARALGLTVVGEGIETPDQLAHLKALGCDNGQGFYFARPMESHAVSTLLRDSLGTD